MTPRSSIRSATFVDVRARLLSFTATATIPDGIRGAALLARGRIPWCSSHQAPLSTRSAGEFEWQTEEADRAGFFEFDVVVSRDDDPDSITSERMYIEVFGVNESPTLDPIPDQTVEALTLLTFTASAFDPDEPQNTLSFDLDPFRRGSE